MNRAAAAIRMPLKSSKTVFNPRDEKKATSLFKLVAFFWFEV